MSKNCSFGGNAILKSLQNFCGADAEMYLEYFSKAFTSNPQVEELEPDAKFAEWYKKNYKKNLDLKSIGSIALKNAVVKYYHEKVPTYQATEVNVNNSRAAMFGYTSPLARKAAIDYIAHLMYRDYMNTERETKDDKRNILSEIALTEYQFIRDRLAELLGEGKSDEEIDEIWDNLTSNCGEYLDKIIKEKEDSKEPYSSTVLNWAALFREMSHTYKATSDNGSQERSGQAILFDEIVNGKLFSSLSLSKYDTLLDITLDDNRSLNNVESNEDTDPDEAGNEYNPDTTMRDHGLHHGEFDDFKKHLTERIKRLLNTVPKLNAPIPKTEDIDEDFEPDLKIDPAIGFPEYVDPTEIASTLYSYVSKDDADSMAESVRSIAEAFPEYAGLSVLANKLAEDRDLRYSFYTNFGKHIVSKAQTILADGVVTYKVSNPNANRLATLRTQYSNEFISNAVNVNMADVESMFDKITNATIKGHRGKVKSKKTDKLIPKIISKIENEVGRTNAVNKAINEMYDILVLFYPSITPQVLTNFVCNNYDMNIQDAMQTLYDEVNTIVKTAKSVQLAIKSHQDEIRREEARNRRLLWENRVKKAGHTAKEFTDVKALRQKDPLESYMFDAPLYFANAMLKYALVKTNLNSTNVHGNQSSDILNSSLITRLKAIFENPERGDESPLQLLAKDYHLDTNTQFRLSNLLIEQDGHAGIFKLVNGKYVPTDYANNLLQFTLFNGAVNQDTETPVLYSEMSKGDYIGTSWANFFSANGKDLNIPYCSVGNYFLRIPSDAPKTFIIRAPRYLVNNDNRLFETGNQDEYDKFIHDVVDRITEKSINVPMEHLANIAKQGAVLINNSNDLFDTLLSTGEHGIDITDFIDTDDEIEKARNIKIIENNAHKDDDGISHILFVYKDANDNLVPYFIKGKYKGGYIYNAELEFVLNATDSVKEFLNESLSSYFEHDFIDNGSVSFNDLSVTRKRIVSRNHQLFKQLRNAFKQELLDGVSAARLMFKTETVKDDDGKPVLINGKPVYRITRDSKLSPVLQDKWAGDLNGLSPVYHFKGKSAYSDGKLTGRVFESDRFIIFDNKNNVVRNYGQELINSVVQYLSTTENPSPENLLHWSETDGVPELNLNQQQEAAIDAKIEEYINNFVDASFKRLQESKDFIRGTRLNIDNVADYMLNHQLMYIASNELLEGDTKYYKDVQTFLKRTKEYQASGNPYGIASLHRTLTSTPLKDIQIGPASWGITLNDRFNAITFHTTKKFNDAVLKNLESVLSNDKLMGDHALSKEDAHVLMYGLDGEGGYTDAKVNDAQSYITFEEWVRRVAARGELEQYTPLINKIINRETLTKDDLKEFIQVQKNIYYDMYYDKITGRVVPRQIKNAEFVLVPQFIEGTELAEVYKFMKANGINQINTDETSKASNNYIVDIFDENGVLKQEIVDSNNESNLKDDAKKEAVRKYKELIAKAKQEYSYNYLYEQQKVPQHMFADNKFAIQIAKKIIDNIQKDHPLYNEKMRYFDLMTTNIRQSFVNLMKEFNIPVDENGNLKSTDATIFEGIDYQKFYDKLKVELGRLGLDDNSLDYATLTGNPYSPGETVMPNYVGIMINKLESIVQSLVTKAVTRQTLHGFHAAQITNIGYVELGNKNTIEGDKSLKYHPKGYYNPTTNEYVTEEEYNKLKDKSGYESAALPYAEVKLPYSAFGIDKNSSHYKNMTDEEIIKELEEKHLDKFIGYRIPTEGKQSVSVMKIKDFIPDGSGSTIVVPNEWVPQTGSDFDVDSVYGIMHKVFRTSNGEVKKILYKNSFDTADWFKYVRDNIDTTLDGVSKDDYNKVKEEANKKGKEAAKKAVKKYRLTLQKIEQEAYNNLPGKYFYHPDRKEYVYHGPKGAVVKVHREIDERFGPSNSREKYLAQLNTELGILNDYKPEQYTPEEYKAITDYKKIIKVIRDSITGDTETESELYKDVKNEERSAIIDKFIKLRYETHAEQAKANGLMSEEEYLAKVNSNPMLYNSQDARDNEIVDIMINIMSHPYSLEENLSRSNFDSITGNDNAAVDKLRNPIEQKKRKNRSPFNILDEAEFQEDAMQGFALKGFSVARDTFCSICNTVRPIIDDAYAPTIVYDYSHLSDKEFTAKLKELHKRFDDKNYKRVANNGKLISIAHNKIGWSNDGDKNIDGKYITVYSSQTTAHILDAMKSGPVPNVNKYTFGVYKTLVDIGSRYETAVGFIMHPAIAVINKYYNRTNSIYATDISTQYIESALNEYCDRLAAIPDSNVKFKKRASLADKLNAVNIAFGTNISTNYMTNVLQPINEKDIALRINDEEAYKDKVGGEVNMIRRDMAHVLHFAKLMELTNNISSVQQVANPDKFGAKQTIFETERVFKKITDYVKSNYGRDKEGNLVNKSVIKVLDDKAPDGKSKDILEAIYPEFVDVDNLGEDKFDNDLERFVKSTTNIKNSAYPSLCAHLKYGSATSIIVNKAFFVTQTPNFRTYISSIEKFFSDGKRLNEKTYKELRTYLINALYRRAGFINSSLRYVKDKGFEFKKGDVRVSNDAEYARIYGYSRNGSFEVPTDFNEETGEFNTVPVTIEDVSDPTQEEIDRFALLSPAQKIEFVVKNIKGESVFDYIKTNKFAPFSTKNTSPGAQLIRFEESSADIDYLRDLFYRAFTNKNPLIALTAADIIKYAFVVDGYQFGRNGVSKLIPNRLLVNDGPFAGTNIIPDTNAAASQIMLYLDDSNLENFIRSHPNLTQINTRRVKKHGNYFELAQRHEDMIFITPNDKETAIKYGILSKNGVSFNSYVRLKFGSKTILYKITPFEEGYAVLTPLNALERNENTDWSANADNNIYPGKVNGYDYFEDLIQAYRNSRAEGETGISVTNFENLTDNTTADKFKAVSYVIHDTQKVREFNVKASSPLGQNLINRATEIVNDPNKDYRYFYTLNLDKYIEENSEIVVSIPTKMTVDGEEALGAPHLFKIRPVSIKSLYKYFVNPSLDRSELSQKELDILTSLQTEVRTRSIQPTYSHMFEIEEFKENTRNTNVKKIKFSTIGHSPKPIVSATMSVLDGVHYMGTVTGEERSAALARNFDSQHIFKRENVAEAHVEDVIIPAAKTIEKAVEDIKESFNRFWEIPGEPNHYYKITDPEVIKEIKKNDALREKYLRAIMDPAAIESKFAAFRDLDIDSQDERLRPYLKKIKESVAKLRNMSIVKTAQDKYVDEVLDKLSNNPYIGGSVNGNISGGVISVISGFYKQSWLNANFNDIQESPNALVQVTMKMVQDNLRATDMHIMREVEAFSSHVEDIKARAAAAGKSINYDNIIDEYGRFKRHYKQKLIEDREKLQHSVDDKKQHWIKVRDSKPNNELSVESVTAYIDYQKAELEYNEWKAKYIEQEAYNEHNTKRHIEDDGYYNTKNQLARKMIDGDGTKYIFAVYQILRDKKARLLRKQMDDVDNPALDEEIDDITSKMWNLRQAKLYDAITHQSIDKSVAIPSNDAAEMIRRAWDDAPASTLLDEWVRNNSQNERKYFKYEPKPHFQQQIRTNLAIVDKYERKDENGVPTVGQDILANNDEYQKAKRWLRRNARAIFVYRGDDSWLDDYTTALNTLHDTVGGISVEYQRIYNNPNYRDENGDLDGIEISKDGELIDKIRKDQQISYNVFRESDFSDRTLLSLAPSDDLVYTDEYWLEMLGAKDPSTDIKKEYKDTITAINNILSPYYSESSNSEDESSGSIDWVRMIDENTEDEAYRLLVSLDALYTHLEDITKGGSHTKSKKEIAEWIENNCNTVRNDARYSNDMLTASMYNNRVGNMLRRVIQGHSKDDTEGNSYLYKTLKLKYAEGTPEYKKYVDIAKTKARRIVKQYTYRTNTKYYTTARNEALKKGKAEYKEWFFKNHVYNPYERKFEPIAIWRKTEYKSDINNDIEIEWNPSYSQTTRKVRDGYMAIGDIPQLDSVDNSSSGGKRKIIDADELSSLKEYNDDYDLHNENYKEGFGHGENYKYGSSSEYDNSNTANEFEQEMADYMQGIISKLVEDKQSQHYIKQGWLPARLKGEGYSLAALGTEAKKLIGFSAYNNGRDEESPAIDYAHDKYIPTPMLGILKRTATPNPLKKPIREECLDEEEYLRKKQAWDKEEARVKKEELELRKELHDRDYESVMKQFIARANKHNSIQHNKMNFYMAQQLLSEYGVYRQRYGIEGDYRKDGTMSDAEQAEYIKKIDEDMLDQFTTTIQRFVNNEWKAPEGSLTRYMSMLQAMTSAKFMILNHKGGVANVTYGEASIHSESMAREFFDERSSIKGLKMYSSGIIDYMANMYSEKSSTLAGAIIKFMDVVDYDEQRGLGYIETDLAEVSKRLNDFAYSAQSAGEHALQNRAMFAMMNSHRLFINPRHKDFGQPKYTYMNLREYMEGLEESALKELLTDEEKVEYNKFKEKMTSDANKFKDYAWFRRDFVTDYVQARFSWARQSEFNRLKKEKLKNAKKEFEDDAVHPTIISQLDIKDGKLAFKEGSLLAEMDSMHKGKVAQNSDGISDAFQFLANFKGRVISVNKKIHGSYDKSGRAKVEKHWWGGIVAQYHKHLPIGFAKRYRSKGYYNEERGSREKGSYVSILDFISIPVKRHQTILNLSDEEVDAVRGVQNLMKDFLDFAFHIRTAYNTMPEYDKANVRRVCADFHAMFGALFACVALKMAATDDDKHTWWYNFALYQVDRLASESSQYMPWVVPSEAKKFFGNPIAGFKEVDDMLNTASALTQMIMGTVGLSDFEPTYTEGVNSGRYKLAVYIERNIPFWRGIRSAYVDIYDNNKAYKVSKNVLGFIDTDKMADKGKEIFD